MERQLYPQTRTTKGEVIDYYARDRAGCSPHLHERPVTRKRWPNGVESAPFFEKNTPAGTPSWVRTMEVEATGQQGGDHEHLIFPFVDDLATLTWLANLAALELHIPQWTVGRRGAIRQPDRLVIDLDPGPGAGLVECAEVALAVREPLADDGLTAHPVTSGSKGMQLYAAVSGRQDARHSAGLCEGPGRGRWRVSCPGRGVPDDQDAAAGKGPAWTGARTPRRRPPFRRTHCAAGRRRRSRRRAPGTSSTARRNCAS